jgi:aldehyde dehydrogenase (NAD+)
VTDVQLITEAYIDGEVRSLGSRPRYETLNPSTGEPIASTPIASADDVRAAVASCWAAHPAWAATRPSDRGRILTAIAQSIRAQAPQLARIESLDTGKPLTMAMGDVEVAARYFEFYAGSADKLHGDVIPIGPGYHAFTEHAPYGVIGIILPWNAPLQQAARSVAPALATGNCIVVKPAEDAPLTNPILAKIASECGLPPGVWNVIPGDGPETGAALVADPGVRRVMFTGSVEVGKIIARSAADRLIPVGLELGGKSPNIVFADADLDRAVEGTVLAITYNSGQACSAGSRLYVEDSVYDEFVARLSRRMSEISVGVAADDPDIGPIATREQFARVMSYLDAAVDLGGKPLLAIRPEVLDRHPDGFYVGPAIFECAQDSRLVREEIFGPVLVTARFSTEEEALRLANDSEYGLVAGIWTSDVDRALRFSARLEAGQVFINNWFGGGVETPFGGWKNSGIGREKGFEALQHYTQLRTTIVSITQN